MTRVPRCKTCGDLGSVFDFSTLPAQMRADISTAEIGAQLEAAIKPCPDCRRPKMDCCDGICAQPEKDL